MLQFRDTSAPGRSVRAGKVADLVLGAALVIAGIPRVYTLQWRVADIPLINLIYALAAFLIALEYIRRPPTQSKYLFLYISGGLMMTAVALLNTSDHRFTWYFAFQDLSVYSGLPVGIAWAYLRGQATAVSLLWRGYVVATAVFAVCMYLLIIGYIPNGGGDDRLLDGAFFTSVVFLTICFPLLWFQFKAGWGWHKLVVLSGPVLCAWFAIISATRSVAIGVVTSVLCVVIAEMRRKIAATVVIVAVLLLAVMASVGEYGSWGALESSHLAARTNSTDLTKEIRISELDGLFAQMESSEWIFGGGFGRGLETPIWPGITTAPHVGIATLLYKAGAPFFVVLMLGPCVIASYRFAVGKDRQQVSLAAAVVIYLSQACVSGGWTFIALFLLGLFLAFTVFRRRTRTNGTRLREVYFLERTKLPRLTETVGSVARSPEGH